MHPIILIPKKHPKAWGSELWLCNNEECCGKLLFIRKGAKFSMHFHAKKREVFWVFRGSLILRHLDPSSGKSNEVRFETDQVVEIPRLLPHQLEALEDSQVVEFSTHHEDSDSYRVAPGDSQK